MWVPTRECLDRILERGIGTSTVTVLGNASVGLIKSAFNPDVDTVLADLDQANFAGYVRKAAGFTGTAHIGPSNLSFVQGNTNVWEASDTTTVNTIFGQFMVAGDATTLLGVEVLDAPIPLPGPGYELTIVERFGLDPSANYGLSLASP